MHRLLLPGTRLRAPVGVSQSLRCRISHLSTIAGSSRLSFPRQFTFTEAYSSKAVNARSLRGHARRPPLQTPRGASYNPLIQQLASRPSPILIYQSESNGPYVTGCFVIGSICVAYALINGHTILFDPLVQPSTFVKITFGLVCSAMFGFGCAAFYKSFRLVRSISVVPVALSNGQRTIHLRIEAGNIRSKTIDVPYEAVTTTQRLFTIPKTATAVEKLQQIQNSKERWEHQRRHIMTLPFRQAGYFLRQGFGMFKKIVSDDEWIFLRVRGKRGRWKVHSKPEWALRNGKHLDEVTRRVP